MPRQGLWKPFILIASVVFYGWWDWRFVFLLAFSAVANQLFAKAIEGAATAAARKWLLAATVAVNLGILGWFKYYGFFVTSVANTLHAFRLNADLPLLRIVLPIGISFLTFRVLSYGIDVYRGQAAHVVDDGLRGVRRLLPVHARRADRPRRRVPPAAGRAARPAAHRHLARLLPDLRRARQEDAACRLPGHPHRQRRLHDAGLVHVARDARRDRRLLGPDLLRLQRLRGHRHRRVAAPRLRAARQLRRPVHGRSRCRTSGAAGT